MLASSSNFPIQLISMLFVISIGCNVGKSAYYNQYEKKYMSASNRYTSIMIFHDVKAIKKQTNDGIYTINIQHVSAMGMICKLDTLEVIRYAIYKARDLAKGMNHKKHYRYIDVVYDSNDDRDINDQSSMKSRGVISCYYQIRMPVENINNARIIRSNNDFSGVDFKRSTW